MLRKKLMEQDWNRLFCTDDVNIMVDYFTENILNVIDVICPLKTIKSNCRKISTFLTQETRDLMKNRDQLLNEYKEPNKN